jgi:hypothetical protein
MSHDNMIKIETKDLTIHMGGTVNVVASVHQTGANLLLLPFVNGRRWGAHERLVDGCNQIRFLIPLPNPGPARIQVLGFPFDCRGTLQTPDDENWLGMHDPDLLLVGKPIPELGTNFPRSNILQIDVIPKVYPHPQKTRDESLFCMQWEPWFCWGMRSWRTAQAVPLVGFYENYNRDVLRQHFLWMIELGIDFILPDWTNHIWGCKHWDERSDGVNAIIHATTLALEVLAEMKAEGLPVPKVALFPGLSNGKPATMEALNEELNWIYHTYIRNPRFSGLWQEYEGKPLMVVLDTGAVGDRRGTARSAFRIPFFKQTLELSQEELDVFRTSQGLVDDRFTVRWMSSQNDTTRHHELGYWSWMDGSIDPPVTYLPDRGPERQAEAVTVSVGFFGAQGWKHPTAFGRRGGSTLLETFQAALTHRPKFIFLHQFNEFTGQPEGHGYGPEKTIFVDTYNVELSDDFEPVSLTAPGSRGDQGGWGFFYLNLAKALMDVYRGLAGDSTILVVSSPLDGGQVNSNELKIVWASVGAIHAPTVRISIDGKFLAQVENSSSIEISLRGFTSAGWHVLTVAGVGARTRYPLSKDRIDSIDEYVDARVELSFEIVSPISIEVHNA